MQEEIKDDTPPPAMPEKPSGIKVFGKQVKMGFSKLFSSKKDTQKKKNNVINIV